MQEAIKILTERKRTLDRWCGKADRGTEEFMHKRDEVDYLLDLLYHAVQERTYPTLTIAQEQRMEETGGWYNWRDD